MYNDVSKRFICEWFCIYGNKILNFDVHFAFGVFWVYGGEGGILSIMYE